VVLGPAQIVTPANVDEFKNCESSVAFEYHCASTILRALASSPFFVVCSEYDLKQLYIGNERRFVSLQVTQQQALRDLDQIPRPAIFLHDALQKLQRRSLARSAQTHEILSVDWAAPR
jgi:hypothetical protein